MSFNRRPNPVFSDEYRALVGVIVEARSEAGLSQRGLAAKLGKSASHISMIEAGQRRVDALELHRLANCLGLEPAVLARRISNRLDALASGEAPAAPEDQRRRSRRSA